LTAGGLPVGNSLQHLATVSQKSIHHGARNNARERLR
jgi:hypothetical protein